MLAVSSYPSRTSPTIRGKYILNNILGTPPPPPPPDVPALDDSKVGSEVSLRKQLEAHRANPVCASCHSKMDVLGFGLENYDAIGKWRTMDGKFPIDVGGTMPNGKSFQTAAEMRTILIDSLPQVSRCLIEKIMTYALGRGMQTYDNRTIDQINKTLAADGYHFQTLIYEVVRSLPFQSRRGELVTTTKRPQSRRRSPRNDHAAKHFPDARFCADWEPPPSACPSSTPWRRRFARAPCRASRPSAWRSSTCRTA